VLIDNWQWSPEPAIIKTGKKPPAPPPNEYGEGYFVRDYDVAGYCPSGTSVVWTNWTWETDAPGDTRVEFTVRTAETATGLKTAPEDPLEFTDPPGPISLIGMPAVAEQGTPNTENGELVVDTTLEKNNRARHNEYLRITSYLKPSTDKLSAPTLLSWNLQFDCLPNQ